MTLDVLSKLKINFCRQLNKIETAQFHTSVSLTRLPVYTEYNHYDQRFNCQIDKLSRNFKFRNTVE